MSLANYAGFFLLCLLCLNEAIYQNFFCVRNCDV